MHSEIHLARRVQFYETDCAGIVHFSWFYRYMEEAEHALWRAAGLSIAPRSATVHFPRVSASFDFRRPLHFEDEIDVHLWIADLSARTIRYRVDVRRGAESVATGQMTIACVTQQPGQPMAATEIPATIASRLTPRMRREGET